MTQTLGTRQFIRPPEIFRSYDLNSLVRGFTNTPLAVHGGQISQDSLIKIEEQLVDPSVIERLGKGQVGEVAGDAYYGRLEALVSVLRVDTEKDVVEVVAKYGNHSTSEKKVVAGIDDGYVLGRSFKHYQFLLDGNLIDWEEVQLPGSIDFFASYFTLGLYDKLPHRREPVRENRAQGEKLDAIFNQLRSKNLEDVDRVIASMTVYTGTIQEIEQQTGLSVIEVIPLSQRKYFKSSLIEAYLSGANALVGTNQSENPTQVAPIILR